MVTIGELILIIISLFASIMFSFVVAFGLFMFFREIYIFLKKLITK